MPQLMPDLPLLLLAGLPRQLDGEKRLLELEPICSSIARAREVDLLDCLLDRLESGSDLARSRRTC